MKISVLTPTFNRADLLEKLYKTCEIKKNSCPVSDNL